MNKKAVGVGMLVTAIIIIALVAVVLVAFVGPTRGLFAQIGDMFGFGGECKSPAVMVKSIEDLLRQGKGREAVEMVKKFRVECYKTFPILKPASMITLAEAYAADDDLQSVVATMKMFRENYKTDKFFATADSLVRGYEAFLSEDYVQAGVHLRKVDRSAYPTFGKVINPLLDRIDAEADRALLSKAKALIAQGNHQAAVEALLKTKDRIGTSIGEEAYLLLGISWAELARGAMRKADYTLATKYQDDARGAFNDAYAIGRSDETKMRARYEHAELLIFVCEHTLSLSKDLGSSDIREKNIQELGPIQQKARELYGDALSKANAILTRDPQNKLAQEIRDKANTIDVRCNLS